MLNCKRLVLLLVFALIPQTVFGIEGITECMATAEHSSVTYLLVDRSDELKDIQNLKQSLSITKKMIQAGERLIVGISTGKASETRVVMDITRPVKSLWVSKLKIRAEEKKFDDCFAKMEAKVLTQNEKHDSSALLETLGVVSKALATDSAAKKRVIVFSDMVQNSTSISFYKKKSVNPVKLLSNVEKKRLIANFKAVEFHFAGAGTGVSDEKARAIEDFWQKYVEKSGGTLKFYGPVLFAS